MPGARVFGLEQLRGDRIDIAEVVDVVAERRAQLVDLAVAGAVADQHLEPQARFPCLPQEQRDVGIVARVQDDVGLRALELGDQRGQIGRGCRVAFPHARPACPWLCTNARRPRRRRRRRGRLRG